MSGVLFFTRLVPPKAGKTERQRNRRREGRKQRKEHSNAGGWSAPSFFGCSRNVVIAGAVSTLLPVPRFPANLRLLSRSAGMAAERGSCHIIAPTVDITQGCFTGHATSLLQPRDPSARFSGVWIAKVHSDVPGSSSTCSRSGYRRHGIHGCTLSTSTIQ